MKEWINRYTIARYQRELDGLREVRDLNTPFDDENNIGNEPDTGSGKEGEPS